MQPAAPLHDDRTRWVLHGLAKGYLRVVEHGEEGDPRYALAVGAPVPAWAAILPALGLGALAWLRRAETRARAPVTP